jgi:hypothetical protein
VDLRALPDGARAELRSLGFSRGALEKGAGAAVVRIKERIEGPL